MQFSAILCKAYHKSGLTDIIQIFFPECTNMVDVPPVSKLTPTPIVKMAAKMAADNFIFHYLRIYKW